MLLTYDNYSIGWIAALEVELAAAIAMLDKPLHPEMPKDPKDTNTYTFGRIGQHNVVVAGLPAGSIGNSPAAYAASNLIRSFPRIRFILMVGVGGGVSDTSVSPMKDVRLGDVVVSSPDGMHGGVIHYDFGTSTSERFIRKGILKKQSVPVRTALTKFRAQARLNGYKFWDYYKEMIDKYPGMVDDYERPEYDRLYESRYLHAGGKNCSDCLGSKLVNRQPRKTKAPVVHYGVIGSANQVMRNAILRDELYRDGIICFEMEAAGMMDIDCMVIRGICDYCDSHKNKDWQPYASAMAAAFAKEFLEALVAEEVEAMPLAKTLDSIDNSLKEIVEQSETTLATQRFILLRNALAWVGAPNPETNFRSNLERQDPGSGTWFLESEQYLQWKNGSINHLWLYGKAGCGKSVMASIAIQDVRQAYPDSPLAIFYFTFADAAKQSWQSCLKSLIVQLGTDEPMVSMLVEAHKASRGPPEEEFLQKVLLAALQQHGRVFVFLDALDESPEDNSTRSTLLKKLVQLSIDAPNVKLFLTSRDLVDIHATMKRLSAYPVPMVSELVDKDISNYIRTQLDNDEKLADLDLKTKHGIEAVLVSKADGMFRWAYCQLQELRNLKLMRPTDVARVLHALPKTLDETYERILSAIDEYSQKEAFVLLQWLAYAQRPLTLGELAETIIIELYDGDEDVVDINNRPRLQGILELLPGLIKIQETSGHYDLDDLVEGSTNTSVQLAHFSVKEYLESQRSVTLAFHFNSNLVHEFISNSCLAYLIRYVNLKHETGSREDLKELPLLEYAAKSWYKHYRDTKDTKRAIKFLCLRPALGLWIGAHTVEPGWKYSFDVMHKYKNRADFISRTFPTFRGLYYASVLGLNAVARDLIVSGVDVNASGGPFGSALQAAAAQGHTDIVKLLIDSGKVDVNAHGGRHGSALHAAIIMGHEQIVRLIIEAGAYVDAGSSDNDNVLQVAAGYGKVEILATLIDYYDMDVNMCDGEFGTALQAAAVSGRKDIVQLLVEKYGADVNAQGGHYGQALQAAVANNNVDVVRTLVEDYGAHVDARGGRYGSALQAALGNGLEHLVVLLEEQYGAKVHPRVGDFATVLYAASSSGIGTAIEMPVERIFGQDTAVKCFEPFENAIVAAVIGENAAGAARLLEDSPTVNVRDPQGATIVHFIAVRENLQMLDIFVNADRSQLDLKDSHGRTPLDYACICGNHYMIEKILSLTHYNGMTQSAWSPLHWACRRGDMDIVKLLSKAGLRSSTVRTTDPVADWTPADIAIYHGNSDLFLMTDGVLKQSYNWGLLVLSDLVWVDTDETPVANRANTLTSTKSNYECKSCGLWIFGTRFLCQTCGDLEYCFMCKHTAEALHPDHEWQTLSTEDDEGTLFLVDESDQEVKSDF